jgi:hypothetical protein
LLPYNTNGDHSGAAFSCRSMLFALRVADPPDSGYTVIARFTNGLEARLTSDMHLALADGSTLRDTSEMTLTMNT